MAVPNSAGDHARLALIRLARAIPKAAAVLPVPPAHQPHLHLQTSPKTYLKEARAYLQKTHQRHSSAAPWTAGFHPGRAPRLSPVDPMSVDDMSGNGRLYRSGNIPSTQDESSPLQLGAFTWKPTDRPQGTLVPDRAWSLHAQLA